MRYLLILVLLNISCSSDKKSTSSQDSRKSQIETLKTEKLVIAQALKDENGWLSRDCDSMIWSGKYASIVEDGEVDIEAAEFRDQPGRFGRRPAPNCWNPIDGDVGSKTTWSRDMFIAGLAPYAWRHKKLEILERHEAYGRSKVWKMGEPFDDGRVLYTPAIIGVLYNAIYRLGGADNANRVWPNVYPSGLVDFQAHLQVMDIWLRGEIAEERDRPKKPEPGALNLNVSETMYERLVEHAKREPKCWTYQAMLGIYDGMGPAIDVILGGDSECSYVRCEDEVSCKVVEDLWALDLVLRRLN